MDVSTSTAEEQFPRGEHQLSREEQQQDRGAGMSWFSGSFSGSVSSLAGLEAPRGKVGVGLKKTARGIEVAAIAAGGPGICLFVFIHVL